MTRKFPKKLRVRKLSSLLALGLRDLRKQERDPKSEVHMSAWLENNGDGYCTACLAGSVMRWTLGLMPDKRRSIWPAIVGDHRTACALGALNYIRIGWVDQAGKELGIKAPRYLNRPVTDYDEDRDQWWADMRKLLADLRREGL